MYNLFNLFLFILASQSNQLDVLYHSFMEIFIVHTGNKMAACNDFFMGNLSSVFLYMYISQSAQHDELNPAIFEIP